MVCVPLKVGFNLWVFTAFMFQAPLVALANVPILKNNPTVGNISFWTSFCFFGQPVAILLYYWIWTQKNAGVRIPTVPEAVAPLSQQLG
uniref:diacylglycerol O-acyltransferase n=1 Tax=Chromera velia CCMP2878 TaxID=1169474 RepID=A0A0G4HV76_9ALVE|eukprot:Cvel_32155.t1-p1 / transcript=Cvel_32155.t1 / gene=Cvel_32155 / organism=Chromera_velia_CCMP2878 / gene_product=Diacylglycerol O-acyltransferase 1, putative / transcript_product=Diacylglycerol O-acyltransferase 1, putative / location=Cvel_scaffold4935:318-947(+) / protein_length=88 / sequence_SO=supercontig / SO=protein_coding / is_pseudo=false